MEKGSSLGILNVTTLRKQSINAWFLAHQSMHSITLKFLIFNKIKLASNSLSVTSTLHDLYITFIYSAPLVGVAP